MRLLHESHDYLAEALKRLLAELNKTQAVYPGTNLRLVCESVSG